MPNNCSTLIQRKQNILHKILRSNSDGKLQNGENILEGEAEKTTTECLRNQHAKVPFSKP